MSTVRAIAVALGDQKACRLVAQRDVLPTLRHLLRIAPPRPERRGRAYWPVVLVTGVAAIKLPFRRLDGIRVAGAVDAVTGRCGLVDVELPAVEQRQLGDDILIKAQLDEAEVRGRWREFFRNYVVRKYRPTEIERLELVSLERCCVPYRVVEDTGRLYLVDELMKRVDPLCLLPPEVAAHFDERGPRQHGPAYDAFTST